MRDREDVEGRVTFVEYEHESEHGVAYTRVRFEREQTRILSFVVQLECEYDGDRHPVIRFDTTHGFAHCDVLHPRRAEEKIRLQLKFNEAFTNAQRDIRERWRFYCERYGKWLREK